MGDRAVACAVLYELPPGVLGHGEPMELHSYLMREESILVVTIHNLVGTE